MNSSNPRSLALIGSKAQEHDGKVMKILLREPFHCQF